MSSQIDQRIRAQVHMSTPEGGQLTAQIYRDAQQPGKADISLNVSCGSDVRSQVLHEQVEATLSSDDWQDMLTKLATAPVSRSDPATHTGSISTQMDVTTRVISQFASDDQATWALDADGTVHLELMAYVGEWPAERPCTTRLTLTRTALDQFFDQVQQVLDRQEPTP